MLPQQTETWPRTVFAIIKVEGDETIAPVALMLTQARPGADYKVSYAITLEPSARIPDLAPASVGAPASIPRAACSSSRRRSSQRTTARSW